MWTRSCTHSACWLAARSHRISPRAKHPSVWRDAKSPGAHAAPAPHLLPHPFPQFVLSPCFHLPHSQQPRNCSALGQVAAVGWCWRNSHVLLAAFRAQRHGSFYIFSSIFPVEEGNHSLMLSGIQYEWWNLPSHWWELLSHQCLNPCEWKMISIPIPSVCSSIRHATSHPAGDWSHFLHLTLHPPPTHKRICNPCFLLPFHESEKLWQQRNCVWPGLLKSCFLNPSPRCTFSSFHDHKDDLRKRLSYTTHKLEMVEMEFDSTRQYLETELRRAQEELEKFTEKLRRCVTRHSTPANLFCLDSHKCNINLWWSRSGVSHLQLRWLWG